MAKIEDNQETILDSLRRTESSLSPSYRHCERTRPFVLAASDRRAQFTSTNLSNAPAFTSQQFSRNKTFTDSEYTHESPRIPTATANSTLDDCEPLPMNHLYANKPLPSSAIDMTGQSCVRWKVFLKQKELVTSREHLPKSLPKRLFLGQA